MQVTVSPQGTTRIEATGADATAFATRPGRAWPASGLRKFVRFTIELDAYGDLVEFLATDGEGFEEDIQSAELGAFIEYALNEARSQIDELLTIEERKAAGGRA